MHKHTHITIGISFYNAESTLLDAVRSVFAQTHESWELILVDDGSTDGSLKLAQSINDPRVTVYSDGENRRLAARLNQIAKLAKYDFMARMDADDLMSPLRLEEQLKLMLSNPEIDLVSTGVCSLTNDNEPVGIRIVNPDHVVDPKGLLIGKSGIVHATLMGRREWFLRNPYKESLAKSQDTNLWVRSYSKNDLNIGFITEALYYYREDDNVSQKQMLLAYSIGRQTIVIDAKGNFSLKVKTKALVDNLVKTAMVKFLPRYSIKIARSRRNATLLTTLEKQRMENEIKCIIDIELPITETKGASKVD